MPKKEYLCTVFMEMGCLRHKVFAAIGKTLIAIFVTLLLPAPALCAQDSVSVDTTKHTMKREVVALKNNLLYDAALTPNLELEIVLARRWSLEIGAGFNPFPLDDNKYPKWRHLSVSVAPRYWFCNVFHRDFISFNVAYAHFNVAGDAYPVAWMYPQIKENRYQGDALMGGISYGWHWAISPHFSIELEGGIDAGYAWYQEYECQHCGKPKTKGGRWLVLPKIGLNISVPLGGDDESLARRCDCELLEEAPDTTTAPVDTIEREPWIKAERLRGRMIRPIPVMAYVPYFEPKVDQMQRLRNRLLRDAEEYEPYTTDMALSADPRNVFLFFDVNVTKMDRNFIQNDMLMDSIMNILGSVKEDPTIRIAHIQIVGFASFDGKQAYNVRLAGERARTIKEYMQSVYALPDSVFAVCNGGESWAELAYQLNKVTFDGKDEVLAIIQYEADLDKREKLIKQLDGGDTYRYMRDELKHILRNLGCITIYIEKE